jgi:hypothetical protein
MTGENIPAANSCGAAPAQHSQEVARRICDASLSHLAHGTSLIARCRDLQQRTPRDTRLAWLATRVIVADAALGKLLTKAVAPPGNRNAFKHGKFTRERRTLYANIRAYVASGRRLVADTKSAANPAGNENSV